MRVGITVDIRYSMFSAGHGNASLSLAKIFQTMKYEVVFLHVQDGSTWWEDVQDLKETSPRCVLLSDFIRDSNEPLDLLVELAFFLKPEERSKIAKRSIWYNRKPTLFSDIESTVYANRPQGRNLEGVHAIWVADLFTTDDDKNYLETLYPSIPIEVVPWVWTPDIVESHRKQSQAPAWPQVYQMVPKDHKWNIHITETNASNTSSCTLPLVIVRNSELTKKAPLSQITVHNMDILKENKFFKENIMNHSEVQGLTYNMMGRQRIIDWVHDPHSIVLSHSRFINLKMGNLEAAWVGIPVVHNSEILKSFGQGLEKTFYSNNSVVGATKALHTIIFDTETVPYITNLDALSEVRRLIVARFYPLAKIQEWSGAIMRALQRPLRLPEPPKPMATNLPVTVSLPVTVVAPVPAPAPVPVSEFSVLFTDMWDEFNESHNMFLLALDAGLKTDGTKVVGYCLDTIGKRVPNIVIFGPFGESWKGLDVSWPKVHFTGENTDPIKDPSVKLNIGYKLPEISDDSYLRMPLWMFEIDWFGANLEEIRNPLPLPIDICTKPNPRKYSDRTKFAAFIVTNPTNPIRNMAFKIINGYKPVDSAGRLYNNVGDAIFAGLGGGGGELKKHEFLKDYRFNICYENASSPGYTTEKLLHAKAAGCVPIYWGDPKVGRDFNENGFINANSCKSSEDLIKLVEQVESDSERWYQIASVPAVSGYMRDLVRRTFSELVKRLLVFGGGEKLVAGVPPFLGAKTTEEAETMKANRPRILKRVPLTMSTESPLFVTATTQRFWPFLIMWLNSIKAHKMSARVYVGSDVSDSSLALSRDKFKDVAEFIRFPTKTPEGFNDFWDTKHYAWKLWMYNTMVNEDSLKGRLIFYMDTATVLMRWPTEWVKQALENGVGLLDDCRQKNKYWCHSNFCHILKVTEEEKESQQIAACVLLFVAGHPVAQNLFTEAYKLSEDQDVIVGEKWAGFGPDGHPIGHRHDQSILSILSQRLNIPRYPIDKVYGSKSARTTFHSGQSIYVHRGDFVSHIPLLEGIDDAFVINLDRREDRKTKFLEFHPDLKGNVRRLGAYDGRNLKLGPSLAALFKANDFFWKKAVMGCALSHLKLWNMLISEPPDIQSFLILEDDARLAPGWRDAWNMAYKSLPNAWDCVYLGGILPPNREGFATTLERVGPGLAKVAPNKFFGQSEATRYFHFCAYAYVLSRRGAEKILNSILEKGGYWTSADHMVCNRVDVMNLYVLDPLVAGASQDDDPAYKTAQFNDFSRVDKFDSDLWNNDERFSLEEIQANLAKGAPLSIREGLFEVDSLPFTATVTPVTPVTPVAHAQVEKKTGTRFLSLDVCKVSNTSLYESEWLQDLFQNQKFTIEQVSVTDSLEEYDDIVLIIIRPLWKEQLLWIEMLTELGKKFKVLHLADENLSDSIEFYSLPNITGIMRFYPRSDLPSDSVSKVLTVPLGYHWQFKGNRDVPHLSTPELPFRELMWSFAGTNWMGRSEDMKILDAVQPRFIKWFAEWNDPAQLKEDEYISLMLNSKFVPCPPGQNVETYRFYEALECGCVPLFIEDSKNTLWLQIFNNEIPFLKLSNWDDVAGILTHFKGNPEQMEKYRMSILVSWAKYKTGLKHRVNSWLKN